MFPAEFQFGPVRVVPSEVPELMALSGIPQRPEFHPEVDTALVQQWIDEDHGADMGRLGLDAADMRARTVDLADDAAQRLRLLVAGFLRLLADGTPHDPDRLG